MSASAKPNVIIFGGLNTVSRTLAAYLVPLEGERRVKHLRIVDKYSVAPATTYLGAEFPKVLALPNVEYKQVNLQVAASVTSAFDPPAGVEPYTLVFDFTGEIRHGWQDEINIKNTFLVSRLLGLEASKRKVKAYVKLLAPFYETPGKGPADEKADVKCPHPLSIWWHETARTLASIEDLNLVLVRAGFMYGPYVISGWLPTVITVGSVYGYLKKPMKLLWSPGEDRIDSVHTDDVTGAMWAVAEWMAPIGRKEADRIAGEQLLFHNEKSKVKEVEGMCPHDQKLVAPLFNIVDDGELTLAKAGQIVTSFFGTTHEFHNMMVNTMAKFKLDDVVEEINEHHVSAWTEMIQNSNPPVVNTPLSAYMNLWQLSRKRQGYTNNKIKKILQYKLRKPEFGHTTIKETVDKWKEEGSWPMLES